MRAIMDRIIVKRDPRNEQKTRGIVIAAPENEPDRGAVVAVGPGKRSKSGALIPVPVEVGDKVIFGTGRGQRLEESGVEYVVLVPEDIIAVDEEKTPAVREFESAIDRAFGRGADDIPGYGGTD